MRTLSIVLVLAALALLYLFVRPLFEPGLVEGPRPESFSSRRFQAITATKSPRTSVETKSDPGPGASPEPRGPLCDRRFAAGKGPIVALLPGKTVQGARERRGWTWINVWAVWCKPCRAEMPLLSSWAVELGTRAPAMVFMSVDDDERQLRRYMADHAKDLHGEVLWVQDPAVRSRFYGALGVEDPPTLPVHAILDTSGRLRCVRVGTIDRQALAEITYRYFSKPGSGIGDPGAGVR